MNSVIDSISAPVTVTTDSLVKSFSTRQGVDDGAIISVDSGNICSIDTIHLNAMQYMIPFLIYYVFVHFF